MAWIELHQAVWTHRKSLIMAAELDLTPADAVKHMAQLWCWALDNAPSGSLAGLPNIVIATGAGWTGDTDRFVEAAKVAGFIDRDPVALHDWDDYAGRLIERRMAERERSRQRRAASRKPPEIPKSTAGRPPDDHQTAVGTVPNRTQPYPTQPNQDQDHRSPATPVEVVDKSKKPKNDAEEKIPYSEDFLRLWAVHPNKVGKGAAWKAFQKAKPRPPVDVLIAAIDRDKKTEQWRRDNGRYVPHLATWLNQRRWEDEPEMKIGGPRMSEKERKTMGVLADFMRRHSDDEN